MSRGWIGVDLDGTLAHYDGWRGESHIGEPKTKMVQRIQAWLETGQEVRIFTARVAPPLSPEEQSIVAGFIERWCMLHIGMPLPVTCVKDRSCVQIWDDRAVRVVANTGEACCFQHLND